MYFKWEWLGWSYDGRDGAQMQDKRRNSNPYHLFVLARFFSALPLYFLDVLCNETAGGVELHNEEEGRGACSPEKFELVSERQRPKLVTIW